MSDPKTTDDLVACRTSTAIPAGMIVWTNYGAVVGVHMPGAGPATPPRRFDTAHFSASDFPQGLYGMAVNREGKLCHGA